MSDDSDPPIYYEYIEKKDNKPLDNNDNNSTIENTQEKSSSDDQSEEDSDSVVIITSIKKIPKSPQLPRVIKLQDQGQVNDSELETDQSQKSLDLDIDLDSESSDCPKFRTPPTKTLGDKVPYSITRDSSSQTQNENDNQTNKTFLSLTDEDYDDYYKDERNKNIQQNEENESEGDTFDFQLSEKEKRLQEKLRQLRQKYLEDVQKALDEYGIERSNPVVNASSVDPPNFDKMSNQEMEEELAKYGFRFTTRTSGISKLTRIWHALNEQNLNKVNESIKKTIEVSTPTDFIRLKSKYYEDILIYVPIPLRGLYREMEEYGIKCSMSKLKQILTNEGVAFLEDSSI